MFTLTLMPFKLIKKAWMIHKKQKNKEFIIKHARKRVIYSCKLYYFSPTFIYLFINTRIINLFNLLDRQVIVSWRKWSQESNEMGIKMWVNQETSYSKIKWNRWVLKTFIDVLLGFILPIQKAGQFGNQSCFI